MITICTAGEYNVALLVLVVVSTNPLSGGKIVSCCPGGSGAVVVTITATWLVCVSVTVTLVVPVVSLT